MVVLHFICSQVFQFSIVSCWQKSCPRHVKSHCIRYTKKQNQNEQWTHGGHTLSTEPCLHHMSPVFFRLSFITGDVVHKQYPQKAPIMSIQVNGNTRQWRKTHPWHVSFYIYKKKTIAQIILQRNAKVEPRFSSSMYHVKPTKKP